MSKLLRADWWFGRTPEQLAWKRRHGLGAVEDALDKSTTALGKASKSFDKAGNQMIGTGLKLTLWVSLPIVATLLLGLPGLILAVVVLVVLLVRSKKRVQTSRTPDGTEQK